MPDPDGLPRLSPLAGWLLALLLVCLWLALRVRILRRRAAAREEGEAPPNAARWLTRLAASPRTLPAVAAVAVVLVLALAWALARGG
jgi:hypothetical protein